MRSVGTIERTNPDFLAVARGDKPADLVLVGARIVDVFRRVIEPGSVGIVGGRIAWVGDAIDGETIIDLGGSYLAPGLIDAHMHVESTQMLPREFVRLAAPHGTTGVVFDPHEIANVLGIAGIRFLMDASRGLPMNILFAASSCVPSSPLETSGAQLEAGDLEPLFDDERVVALAEMMNFPGVVHADPGVLAKVRLGLDRRIVDGHCPGLSGRDLCAYVAAGISSDHECTTAEEAREKVSRGMRVYLRQGSAARNIEALLPAVTEANAHRFCFCTDDRHPGDLHEQGHIDHAVRIAVALGLDPVTALAMGSLHAADHYRQGDRGGIAPGRCADLIVFDDLADIRPRAVYFQGEEIARDGVLTVAIPEVDDAVMRVARTPSVHLPAGLGIESFAMPIEGDPAKLIRVIGADPHQLVTAELQRPPCVRDGRYVADPDTDLLKLAVIARHGVTDRIGLGFVSGFGFAEGALASTVGHDSHNLSIVGTNDEDMLVAARELERVGGGQCVVRRGEVLAVLPLPIAGLISDADAETIIEQQRGLVAASKAIGCPLDDPFMPLSFLTLPVIPKLKLTDLGLVDVELFAVVPLEVR